jgi:hypothetical protein
MRLEANGIANEVHSPQHIRAKMSTKQGFGVQIVRDEQFCGANIIEVQISKNQKCTLLLSKILGAKTEFLGTIAIWRLLN